MKFLWILPVLLAACSPGDASQEESTGPNVSEIVEIEETPAAELTPLQEGQKMARCVIGPDRYSGPCVFRAEPNGSFAVSMRDQSPVYAEVSVISVSITEPGKAEVFGLTTFGNNSRWGSATRSQEDKACWVGSDFSVCAY